MKMAKCALILRIKNAVRFCAVGAVTRVVRNSANFNRNVYTLEDLLDNECNIDFDRDNIVRVNDHDSVHAHRSVMGVFNRAIKKLQKGK